MPRLETKVYFDAAPDKPWRKRRRARSDAFDTKTHSVVRSFDIEELDPEALTPAARITGRLDVVPANIFFEKDQWLCPVYPSLAKLFEKGLRITAYELSTPFSDASFSPIGPETFLEWAYTPRDELDGESIYSRQFESRVKDYVGANLVSVNGVAYTRGRTPIVDVQFYDGGISIAKTSFVAEGTERSRGAPFAFPMSLATVDRLIKAGVKLDSGSVELTPETKPLWNAEADLREGYDPVNAAWTHLVRISDHLTLRGIRINAGGEKQLAAINRENETAGQLRERRVALIEDLLHACPAGKVLPNLGELPLRVGDVREALTLARMAIDFADVPDPDLDADVAPAGPMP